MPDPPETRRFQSADRGQMLQDYTIGIAIFIVAVMFVVGAIPTIFTPFAAPVGADQTAQADRYAAEVMDNITRDNSMTTLDETATESFFDDEPNVDGAPLLGGSDVNTTLVAGSGTVLNETGPPYSGHSTAAATRIVTGDDETCPTETCRIEVRIW